MSLPEMEPSSARGSIVGTLRAFSNGQRDSKNPRAYAELEDDDDVLPPPPPPPGAPPNYSPGGSGASPDLSFSGDLSLGSAGALPLSPG